MAYQRPFLISMKKSEPHQPWGFRTFGGKDYGEPHVVEKVLDDSNAERGGLREGDEIIQIGRINVQDMAFGQVQEILSRCGNKIEMFIIREDLLSPRKGQEPPFVKAVVHNPYNSPLNLYSTENIADTLAKQTEVLTEGIISSAEEEDAPENLSFQQKSAVFQLLEEQAKQDTVNQYHTKGSPQRKAVPPPPPKPKPPASTQDFQDKENYAPQESYQTQYYKKTIQSQGSVQALKDNYYSQPNSVDYQRSQQTSVNYSQAVTTPPIINGHLDFGSYNTAAQPTTVSTSSSKSVPPLPQDSMTTTYRQNQQQPSYHTMQTQQHQQQQEINKQSQRQWQQQQHQRQPHPEQPQYQIPQQQYKVAQQQRQHQAVQQQQEQHYQVAQQQRQHQAVQQQQEQQYQAAQKQRQHQAVQQHQEQQYQAAQQQQRKYQQQTPHQQQQQQHPNQHQVTKAQPPQQLVESIFQFAPQSVGTPMVYKAPPPQKNKSNWPPQSPTQQNGRWNSPSPTPGSPSRSGIEAMWPPRQSTVKELPKTGFNPVVLRDQGSGRRCVWPPPKPDDEFRSGRTTPQSPITGRRIAFNPSPSPPLSRKVPFGSMSPVSRRKDIFWPPAQPVVTKSDTYQQRPSPTFARKARFDDYVKQHAGCNVPSTYRPPPGTQHVEYC